MEELEINGKTVEEAIQRALKQLDVTREQIEVTVLNEGRSGILGIGAEDARIRVNLLIPKELQTSQEAEIAKDILENLLAAMDINATVVSTGSPVADSEEAPISFDIQGDDLGILIGRRGQTLASLQYIVRLMVAQNAHKMVPITIDVEGYKERHYDVLRSLAKRMADQVVTRRTPMALRPMPPYERRIVHMTLANYPGVETESTGDGSVRKVVIYPKR